MSSRIVVLTLVALIGAVVWIAVRNPDSSNAPLAGPAPDRAELPVSTTELDRGTSLSSTATAAVSQPASSTTPSSRLPAADDEAGQAVVLYGYIRGAEEASPANDLPWIAVFDRDEQKTTAKASADGAYSISGLQPGRYRVNAGAGSSLKAEGSVDLALADSPKRFDIALRESPSLLVKVVDEAAKPLSQHELGAIATREPPGEWIDETPNENPFGLGRFEPNEGKDVKLEPACLGRLILDVEPPLFVSIVNHQRVIDTRKVELGQKEIDFIVKSDSPLLKEGRFHVRFVDQANQPIDKLWAVVEGGSSAQYMRPEGGELTSALPPAVWRIQPFAEGFEQHDLLVRIEPGADTDLGTVILEREQWISGTIVEPHKSNERMSLRCDLLDADGEPQLVSGNTMTYVVKADRTFRIGSRRRGLYLMTYYGREAGYGIWAQIVNTRAGPVENLQVNLVPGVPVMVRPSGDDWHSITFKITDDSGARYLDSRLWSSAPQKILLAPGRYKVQAKQGSAPPTTRMIDVASDTLDLQVP